MGLAFVGLINTCMTLYKLAIERPAAYERETGELRENLYALPAIPKASGVSTFDLMRVLFAICSYCVLKKAALTFGSTKAAENALHSLREPENLVF